MTRAVRLLPVLLLLAGCAGPSDETPTLAPSPTVTPSAAIAHAAARAVPLPPRPPITSPAGCCSQQDPGPAPDSRLAPLPAGNPGGGPHTSVSTAPQRRSSPSPSG